jgi:NAD(P)-dependent dehydrogenase (short-subunit alcohol dehydrogenase family)
VKATSAEFMDAYPKPIGRMSTAAEQGWVMAFLNSPAASYVSGENIYTDGGAGNGMLTGAIKPPSLPGR